MISYGEDDLVRRLRDGRRVDIADVAGVDGLVGHADVSGCTDTTYRLLRRRGTGRLPAVAESLRRTLVSGPPFNTDCFAG
jgi:hypothetical protein